MRASCCVIVLPPSRALPKTMLRIAARTMEGEVLEDDGGPTSLGRPHEHLRHAMEPLADAIPLPPPLPIEEDSLDASIVGLLPRKPPTSAKVDHLDLTYATACSTGTPILSGPTSTFTATPISRVA